MLDFIAPIIAAAVMSHNFTSSTPELSSPPPEATYKDSYTVEVVGQKDSKVFVNGKEVALTLSNGKAYIDLNTSGAYGSSKDFKIILKNKNNLETKTYSFSINKAKPETSRLDAIKLLRQSSYTSYETQIDEVMLNGEMAWIDKQLNTPSSHDNLTDDNYGYMEAVARRQSNGEGHWKNVDFSNLEETYPEVLGVTHALGTFHNAVLLEKMFESEDQLRHRMALALSQIIVVSPAATAGVSLSYRSESLVKLYDELYRHSFGNYRDVLKSACMSSAMSYYLTFLGNMKENIYYLGKHHNNAPDENFARELMQLFSIGIYELNLDGSKKIGDDGHPLPSYTQEDVSELAKVFTGWDWWSSVMGKHHGTVYGRGNHYINNVIHDNTFHEFFHDFTKKEVLGTTIPAGLTGEADVDAVIDILMKNANIAPHVSRHLIMRLVTSNPTPAYIARVSSVFNDNGHGVKGDLKATVEAILKDEEARGINEPENFGKVDEFMLAFSHFASRLNVQELRDDNKYNYKWSRLVSQMPLNAPGVFNFYTNEDAPSDAFFMDNNLVAPEMTTRSDKSLKNFMIASNAGTYDAYSLVNLYSGKISTYPAKTWEEWLEMENPSVGLKYDFKDIYDFFLPIHTYHWYKAPRYVTAHWLEKPTGTTPELEKENLEKLYDFMAIKFLGKKLPTEYRDKMVAKTAYDKRPTTVVHSVLRNIVNSSQFMILD